MNEPLPETGERRLQAYLARLAEVLGHADRRERVVNYCTGLLLPGERKSGPAPGEWRGEIRTSRGRTRADPFHAGARLGRGAVAEARV